MSDHNLKQDQLTRELMEKNGDLSEPEARKWIELLWEDFEATRAKAGREYKGTEVTEQIIRQWVTHYGPHLDDFVATNPKFKKYFEE
ncbi:YfhJ family protein [Salimicrobium flavidum]|uniref:WVELL protein n=1 Tax=Salimicrobium flavidum TaxID=570947 RepID=A0A1N7JH30_9BACI|nr:YfhJ family protein [Salimicrobium flavidum]SIS48673.1 WVELL protein [Salimicrobium flavidum]